MNLSPVGSFTETLIVMSHASSETEKQLDVIEKEAFEAGKKLPTSKQNEYNLMVKRGVNQIRMQIAKMRAKGKTEYDISRAIIVLAESFKTSNDSFIQKNQLYSHAKCQVKSNFYETNNTLNSLNSKFGRINRLDLDESLDEESTGLDLNNLSTDLKTKIRNTVDILSFDVKNDKIGVIFKLQLNDFKDNIQNRLNEMPTTGYKAYQMQKFAEETVIKLQDFKYGYTTDTKITNEKVMNFQIELNEIQEEIRQEKK